MAYLSVLLVLFSSQPASVPRGTRVEATLQSPVRTASSKMGDGVVAVLRDPIRLADRVVVPKGSRLNGRVETIEAATRTNDGRVRLVFREIEFQDGRRTPTWITDSFDAPPVRRNQRSLIYVAAGGSIGALIGGKAARLAGILGGALTGFVIAANSGTDLRNLTLKPGKALHLELGEDLILE